MKLDSLFLLIFIIIACSIIIFFVWNVYSYKKIQQARQQQNHLLNDEKYYELKSKQEFLLAIGTLIAAVIAFIGYDSYKNFQEAIQKNLEDQLVTTTDKLKVQSQNLAEQQKNIDTLNASISRNNIYVARATEILANLDKKQEALDNKLNQSENSIVTYNKRIKDIQDRLSTIANKNIINQEIYLVKDLKYHFEGSSDTVTYYFKNLQTINGEPLPTFKDTPIVIPVSNVGAQFQLSKVTPNYFQLIYMNSIYEDLGHDLTFTAMISVIHKTD